MTHTFCQQPGGVGLTVNILQPESMPTTVRLNLSLDREMNPCARPTLARRQGHHRMYELISPLVPPQGAQQRGGGGGGGSNEVHTTATLTTNLALADLANHYADQLRQAGWAKTDSGVSGPLAWHTWHFTSEDDQEPWSGLFFILKTPGKLDDYFLYVRAAWTMFENDQKFTGWLSSSSTISSS